MRVVAALVTALVAGCFQPTYDHPACGTGDSCPTGFVCLEGYCESRTPSDGAVDDGDAAIDADPNDLDGDGVPNDADNCPTTADATQADEDGDHVGDVCDPCPIDTVNTDSDGDGVGDKCDPNPGAAGERLVFFVGFSDNQLPAGWVGDGVTFANGKATITAGFSADRWLGVKANYQRLTTSASVAMIAHGQDTNMAEAVGVGQEFQLASMPYNYVEVDLENPSAPDGQVELIDRPSRSLNIQRTNVPSELNRFYQLILTRRDKVYTATIPNLLGSPVQGTSTQADLADPYVGIDVFNTTAQVDWVMAVSSP